MDKIKIIILALTIGLVSCKKEEQPEPKKEELSCSCGTVRLHVVTYNTATGGTPTYWYWMTNHCTGNRIEVPFSYEYTEEEYCTFNQW